MPRNNAARTGERGNVFLIILLGVVLFAGLAMTISRSMRSEGTSNLSNQQAALAATDVIAYAQKIERAVNRVRRKSISENDISLEYNADYVNANCDTGADPEFPDCQVFNSAGGNVAYLSPDNDVTTSEWHFTGATCIIGIGSSAAGCDSNTDNSDEALIAVLPNIAESVCDAINSKLNVGATPASVNGHSAVKFTGAFADGTLLDGLNGISSACFSNGGNFHFYSVLIER